MLLDVTVEEAKRLSAIQMYINRRYAGGEKLLTNWSALCSEMKGLIEEAGFVAEITMREMNGNWIPQCDIVGRTDKALAQTVASEGTDIERRHWEAVRESSKELEAKGVDTSLLD